MLAIWPPKLQLTNWSSSVQLSWLPSQDAWGAEEFLNKSSRKPAAVTATDPPDAGHNHTRRKNHKSGRENLSWNHSQSCVLLLPFIWSPSSLGGVHCAQRVGAHVNVHGCDGGGLVGRGEVEWHDICTNHQSTRWWVVVAGMVVPAGQATDGLATVQVSQWSALCAAAVPSPSCCRPATHRHPGVQCPAPQLTTSQPRLVGGWAAAAWTRGCLWPRLCLLGRLTFVSLVWNWAKTPEERRPSPPRRPPARPGPVPAGNTRKPDGEVSARDVDQSQAAVLRKARRTDGQPANQRASFKSRHQRQKEYYDDLNVRYRLSTVAGWRYKEFYGELRQNILNLYELVFF